MHSAPRLKAGIFVRALIRRVAVAGAAACVARQARARAWLDKQVKFDPDLWIVEIEDRDGRAFVDEPIV